MPVLSVCLSLINVYSYLILVQTNSSSMRLLSVSPFLCSSLFPRTSVYSLSGLSPLRIPVLSLQEKKRVSAEEDGSRTVGLGIRLLPESEEDSSAFAEIQLHPKFETNCENGRAGNCSAFSSSLQKDDEHTHNFTHTFKRGIRMINKIENALNHSKTHIQPSG